MMKYTLHIAFDKRVGDILLRVCEYAKKYGSHSANHIHPIRFDFSNTNVIEVKRLEKKCLVADIPLFAMESFCGIPVKWVTENTAQRLKDGNDIEELETMIHKVEHELYPHTINELLKEINDESVN